MVLRNRLAHKYVLTAYGDQLLCKRIFFATAYNVCENNATLFDVYEKHILKWQTGLSDNNQVFIIEVALLFWLLIDVFTLFCQLNRLISVRISSITSVLYIFFLSFASLTEKMKNTLPPYFA